MPRECAIESIRKSDERRKEIVVKKRVHNDGSFQQRWLPDIVERIPVEILDRAMSNVIQGCRRWRLIFLHDSGLERASDGTLRNMPRRCTNVRFRMRLVCLRGNTATRDNGDLWCLKLGGAFVESTIRSCYMRHSGSIARESKVLKMRVR